ncbi:MAG: phosphate ABC transporter substrate-binding protein [Anaerolineae bacterium]
MRRAKRALAIITFTLVSCSSQVIPASTPATPPTTLLLYGTTATLPLIQDLTSAYSLTHPNLIFETQVASYESLVERVMRLEIPYFVSTYLPIDSPLLGYPIGQDGIAVIVHPDNPVTALTTEQVRRIYEGEIVNWREVGGSDLPIEVVSREDGSGTRREFESQVMGERQTTLLARLAPTSAAMVTSVAALRGGIGYVSISYLDDRVRALRLDDVEATQANVANNTYPLRSIIYVVGVEEPVTDYRAFIAWMQSPEGQAVVAQHYAPAP